MLGVLSISMARVQQNIFEDDKSQNVNYFIKMYAGVS